MAKTTVDSKTAPSAELPDMVIPISEAAAELQIGAERIRQFVKDGLVERGPRGMVSLLSLYRGYVKFLRDDQRRSSKSASTSRVNDARAKEIELKTAEREGRLMDVDEVRDVVSEWAGKLRAGLSGLPARLSRDMTFRRKIEAEIDDVLRQVTDHFSKAMGGRPGAGAAADPNAGNDAGRVGRRKPRVPANVRKARKA